MNETRKQIIELIEPFMDKTLSEGCIFMDDVYTYIIHYETDYTFNCTTRIGTKLIGIKKKLINECIEDGSGKIIGHYDITAVLKFMYHKEVLFEIFDYIVFYGEKLKEGLVDIRYSFPSKPLSLYTEQEEKDLLDLLLKLKDYE